MTLTTLQLTIPVSEEEGRRSTHLSSSASHAVLTCPPKKLTVPRVPANHLPAPSRRRSKEPDKNKNNAPPSPSCAFSSRKLSRFHNPPPGSSVFPSETAKGGRDRVIQACLNKSSDGICRWRIAEQQLMDGTYTRLQTMISIVQTQAAPEKEGISPSIPTGQHRSLPPIKNSPRPSFISGRVMRLLLVACYLVVCGTTRPSTEPSAADNSQTGRQADGRTDGQTDRETE